MYIYKAYSCFVECIFKNTQYIRVLRTACEVRLSLIFLGPEFFGNLNAFEKANLAKLVMQVSIGERRGT